MTPKNPINEEAVLAAIATALYEFNEDNRNVKSTSQTITRRTTPWNSKIFGLRDFPRR